MSTVWQPIAKFPKDGKPYPVWGKDAEPAFISRNRGEEIPACYTHWRDEMDFPAVEEEPSADAGIRDTVLSTLAEFAASLNEETRDDIAGDLTSAIEEMIQAEIEEQAGREEDADLKAHDDLQDSIGSEFDALIASMKSDDRVDMRIRLYAIAGILNREIRIPVQ